MDIYQILTEINNPWFARGDFVFLVYYGDRGYYDDLFVM